MPQSEVSYEDFDTITVSDLHIAVNDPQVNGDMPVFIEVYDRSQDKFLGSPVYAVSVRTRESDGTQRLVLEAHIEHMLSIDATGGEA